MNEVLHVLLPDNIKLEHHLVQTRIAQNDTKIAKVTKANEKAFQNVKQNSKLVVMTD